MDSLKIKNKIADILTFTSRKNIDTRNPVLERFEGKLKDIIAYKKNLYKIVNRVLYNIKGFNNTLEFFDTDPYKSEAGIIYKSVFKGFNNTLEFFDTDPYKSEAGIIYKSVYKVTMDLSVTNFISGKIKTIPTLRNKTDIFNAAYIKIGPTFTPSQIETIRKDILEHFNINEKNADNGKIMLSKPRIYFDYLNQIFKLELKIFYFKRYVEKLKYVEPKYSINNLKKLDADETITRLPSVGVQLDVLDEKIIADSFVKIDSPSAEQLAIDKEIKTELKKEIILTNYKENTIDQFKEINESSNRILGKVLNNLEATHGKNDIIDYYKNKLSEEKEVTNSNVIETTDDASLNNLHIKDSVAFHSQYESTKKISSFV